MHPKRHSDASERRGLGFFEAPMAGWMVRSRGECPKFQLLKYNYSVSAGQSVAILGFKLSTFNNSTIWDITLLKALWSLSEVRRLEHATGWI